MRIAWISLADLHGTGGQADSTNASARYRMLLPAQQLARLGHEIEIVTPATPPQHAAQAVAGADTVVLSKLLSDPNGSYDSGIGFYRQLLLRTGPRTRVVFDVNDDHFDVPAFREFYVSHNPHAWVASSEEMGRALRELTRAAATAIPDPYEGPLGSPHPILPSRYPRLFQILDRLGSRRADRWRISLLWFGHPAGLPHLRRLLPELEEVTRSMPLRLHCVTAAGDEVEALLASHAQSGSDLPLTFEAWSKATTWQALRACDIVLLPGELSSGKVKVKSANRLVEAIRAGRFAVAHALPAYREFSDYAYVGESLGDAIVWAARHPRQTVERLARGQDYVAARFSAEAIGERWLGVMRGPEPSASAPSPSAAHAGRNAGLLTAIYDLGWYAPTFNIMEFLVAARIWQQAKGFRGIRLVILQRHFSDSVVLQPQLPAEYDFRIHDVLLGAAGLFPLEEVQVTSDLDAVRALARAQPGAVFPPVWKDTLAKADLEGHRYYLHGFLRDHAASGAPLPGLRIPVFAFKKIRALLARHPRPWITITLRRAVHLPSKNSDLAVWTQVAKHFRDAGASVFMIPDIETLEQFDTPDVLGTMSVSNFRYRAALYDACDMNLGVSNGSMSPLLFNPSAAWVIAKWVTPGTNTSIETTHKLLGMKPGDDFWNRVPWQKVMWSSDSDAREIVENAERILRLTHAIRGAIATRPLLCDPWGKPDGTIGGLWQPFDASVSDPALNAALKDRAPYSPKRWMVEAEEFLAAGQFEGALHAAREAIELDGRYVRPYRIAAACLSRLGHGQLAARYDASAAALEATA